MSYLNNVKRVESVYTKNGYKNRRDYLEQMAEKYATDLDIVLMLADMLGMNEDFDGLIVALEDIDLDLDI